MTPRRQDTPRLEHAGRLGVERFQIKPVECLCDGYQIDRFRCEPTLLGRRDPELDPFTSRSAQDLSLAGVSSDYAFKKSRQPAGRLTVTGCAVPCTFAAGRDGGK